VIAIALVALVGAGCGGSDEKPSDTSNLPVAAPSVGNAPAGSKKAYIAQADVTCSELNAKIQKLPQPKSPKDLGPLYREIATDAKKFYDKFHAIPKPRGDARVLARYERNLRSSIALTDQVAVVVAKNRTKSLAPLVKRVQQLQNRNRKIADRYGFQICGGVVR
jgi:hypothetical protein